MANATDSPRVGDEVYTLDMKRLGTVQQVWPDVRVTGDDVSINTSLTPSVEPGPLARPGVFQLRADGGDLYVPCGAVARVEGHRVILGVPAETVGEQGWAERPRQLAQ